MREEREISVVCFGSTDREGAALFSLKCKQLHSLHCLARRTVGGESDDIDALCVSGEASQELHAGLALVVVFQLPNLQEYAKEKDHTLSTMSQSSRGRHFHAQQRNGQIGP